MKERRTERTLDRDGGSSACMMDDMGAERQGKGLLRTFFHAMPDRLGDGLPERDGDPKGVGASTTRARYSGKRHRHTPSFRPHPRALTTSFVECWGTYHPFSNILVTL